MSELDKNNNMKGEPVAQTDPLRNPNGLYAGPLKRVAITDGEFVTVENRPPDMRNVGRLYKSRPSINDLSNDRFE